MIGVQILVDYEFISGTKMHKQAGYDLTQTIKDGKAGKSSWRWAASANPVYMAAPGQSSPAAELFVFCM